jgi:hypothetical protein
MASRNASFREDVFVAALMRPLRLAIWAGGIFLGLLVAAWVVNAVFVFHVWSDGIGYLREVLLRDVDHLGALAARQGWPDGVASRTANAVYRVIFEWTGIHRMGARFAEGVALSVPDSVARGFYIRHAAAIDVAMVGTQLFGVRVVSVVIAIPPLLLMYAVGAIQGVVDRCIRTVGGGRESASLYHRAKHGQVVLLAMAMLITFVMPWVTDVRIGLVILGATTAVGAWLQWRFYKKAL